MRAIKRYNLDPLAPEQVIQMPQRAQVLALQIQGEKICIFCDQYSEYPLEDRKFRLFRTGAEIPDGEFWYIDSVRYYSKYLYIELHVYEETHDEV